MLAGELYYSPDKELAAERAKARLLFQQLNALPYTATAEKTQVLRQLIPNQGEGLTIEPPFYCDYGTNIIVGDRVFFNFNCIVLDICPVTIGNDVLIAPNVQIYGGTHPTDWQTRASYLESGKPISIGNNVWIGGGAIICPGVSIGEGAIIGAGSVVTKDIPPFVMAVGNPCRVIRELEH